MPVEKLKAAHGYATRNRAELEKDVLCGCFSCRTIFHPKEITKWIDEGETALCPYCGANTVLGSYSRFPITNEFLKRMQKYWFSY